MQEFCLYRDERAGYTLEGQPKADKRQQSSAGKRLDRRRTTNLRRSQLIIIATLSAIILGVAVAVFVHEPARLPVFDDEGGSPLLAADGQPRMRGVTYTHVENGVRKWSLTASGAKQNPEDESFTLADVRLEFFPKGGGKVTIRGNTGRYARGKRTIMLEGDVVATTHDGIRLVTDNLAYNDVDQTVDTDAPVHISGVDFDLKAKGMRVFVPQDKVVFKKDVVSNFIPSGEGPPPGVTMD